MPSPSAPPPVVRDEYDDDDAFQSPPPHLPLLHDVDPDAFRIPALPEWKDDIDIDQPSHGLAGLAIHPSDFAASDEADSMDEDDEDEEEEDDEEDPTDALNYFVHNGYRYDGDIFELRPPQERSIASRPERVLEHKPPLLSNRQTFNRVYSEGTYNARPSSLRQPRRSSSRFSISSLASNDDLPSTAQIDTPETQVPALPVTRPPSLRPSAATPLSPHGLCRTIEEVRQSTNDGRCNQNLYGLLAYSSTPITRISGEKPDLLSSKCTNVCSLPRETGQRKRQNSIKKKETPVEVYAGPSDPHDENSHPHVIREKRGRSYTSFVKSTPYSNGSGSHRTGLLRRSGEVASQKRTPFWRSKLLSR